MGKKVFQKSNRTGKLGKDAEERSKDGKGGLEFNFRLGKFSLGGIFDGVEKFLNLAEKAERAGGELRCEGMIRGFGRRKDARGVYGFTIRTGIGGKESSQVKIFGNTKKRKKGPRVK